MRKQLFRRRHYDQRVQPYADDKALINDPQVLTRGIADIGEPLVDISTFQALAIDRTRGRVQQLSDNPFQVRSGVAERLVRAQASLPDGYQLQIKEGWRPIWVQERLWEKSLSELRASRPDLTGEDLVRENTRFTAPPDSAPPHSTGGAVDLVLLYQGGHCDMGWGFNQPGEGSRTDYGVPGPARRNRDLLAQALDAAGFINYPAEWWHWSYGDRYWAFQTSREAALYGPR
jgi:zinc D-Ala-D-Ala dipeptidase